MLLVSLQLLLALFILVVALVAKEQVRLVDGQHEDMNDREEFHVAEIYLVTLCQNDLLAEVRSIKASVEQDGSEDEIRKTATLEYRASP